MQITSLLALFLVIARKTSYVSCIMNDIELEENVIYAHIFYCRYVICSIFLDFIYIHTRMSILSFAFKQLSSVISFKLKTMLN